MLNSRMISAMKKAGFEVTIGENNKHIVNGPENQVTWFVCGDEATCVYVRDHNMHDDLQSDYHAGFFARTIKRAVGCALEKRKAA